MVKISKRVVDSLQPGARDRDHFDDDLKGFGVRVRRSGRRTYFVMSRLNGAMRRFTIGTHGPVTPELARKEAKRILADVSAGKNPNPQKDDLHGAPTVRTFALNFMQDYVPGHCRPTTAAEYKRSIELFILPRLGAKKLAAVKRSDAIELHYSLRKIPYQANRTLGVFSVLMSQAETWGLRPEGTNPCRGVKRFKERRRERFLSPQELQRLAEVLVREAEFAPSAVACIRLLILTGCRLREIQTLMWRYVDLANQMIHLPDSKTGKKTVYLGHAAVEELRAIPRLRNNPYVITGLIDGQHLTDMQKPWRRIRKLAGLEDVRIHDLRHTFASNGICLGKGLSVIGKLLGHTQAQTTARYAHLAEPYARASADEISGSLASSIGPSPLADPHPNDPAATPRQTIKPWRSTSANLGHLRLRPLNQPRRMHGPSEPRSNQIHSGRSLGPHDTRAHDQRKRP